MHPQAALVLLGTLATLATSVPTATPAPMTPNPLHKRNYRRCDGNSKCSNSKSFIGQCDNAFRLPRDGDEYHASPRNTGQPTGVCSGNCGVFVNSFTGRTNCEYSGAILKSSFNNIRANGCRACGYEYYEAEWDKGCGVKIDYLSNFE